MDGDKDLDILTTNGDLHILLNNLPQLPNGVSDVTIVPNLIYPNPAEDVLYIKTNRFDYSTRYSKTSPINELVDPDTHRD
jgi:hypothetical protein